MTAMSVPHTRFTGNLYTWNFQIHFMLNANTNIFFWYLLW
jgi:hypothetical protein